VNIVGTELDVRSCLPSSSDPSSSTPLINQGLGSTEVMFERWKDHFDYAYHEEVNSMIAITVHPQCIGRAHLFKMFERFIEYVVGQDGVWMTTLSDIYDTWVEG
jgi:peptidoglycan/xylan/chitin deacetylase (PgdA/CDA1 family)